LLHKLYACFCGSYVLKIINRDCFIIQKYIYNQFSNSIIIYSYDFYLSHSLWWYRLNIYREDKSNVVVNSPRCYDIRLKAYHDIVFDLPF